MRVLVLGGDGFIGSHFVDEAVALGYEVTVFDRLPYGVSRNLEHQRGNIRFISGEFANRNDIARALEGQTIVFHFICITNPAESWNDPFIEIEENLRYSIQLFDLAVKRGVKKIVFPSSGGTVYGSQENPVDEKVLVQPLSPYGINKTTTEYFLNYFKNRFGIAADIYRIGNAYGPRQPIQREQGVIAVWMRDILNEAEINIYGDDKTLRDYVYIKDIAALMTHSLRNINSSDVYNLGSGEGTSIIQLLDIFKTVIDKPFKFHIHPRRPMDNASIVLDSSKLLSHFPGFKFQRLKEKIAETWEEFKNSNFEEKHAKNEE